MLVLEEDTNGIVLCGTRHGDIVEANAFPYDLLQGRRRMRLDDKMDVHHDHQWRVCGGREDQQISRSR
jgi:hypothetical protein